MISQDSLFRWPTVNSWLSVRTNRAVSSVHLKLRAPYTLITIKIQSAPFNTRTYHLPLVSSRRHFKHGFHPYADNNMKIINSTFSSFVYGAATRLPLSRCGQLPRTVYSFAIGTILNAIEDSGFEVYFDVPRDPLIASSIDRSKVIRKRRVRCLITSL